MSRVAFSSFGLVCALHGLAAHAAAPCTPKAPAGLYVGTARGAVRDQRQITLNLVCNQGRYTAQFFTAQSDFTSTATSVSNGRARIAFKDGTTLGHATLRLSGQTLIGSFSLEGRSGSVTLRRVGPSLGLNDMKATLALTPAQWRQDLKVLASELPTYHANAFAFLPRRQFDAGIERISRQVSELNGDEIFVQLQELVNRVGDGHTNIRLPEDSAQLPIKIARFGESFRIVAVGPGLDQALGLRLVSIDGLPVAEAWRRVMRLTPAKEFISLRDARALTYLATGLTLHGLDISAGRTQVVLGLQTDEGASVKMDIHSLPTGARPVLKAAGGATTLSKMNPDASFWCQDLSATRTVYCAFRAYPDLKARAAEMNALIDQAHPEKLIIDLRDNGGGNFAEGYTHVVRPIARRRDINVKGRLYVLIGARTFSAAMNNAVQFQDETNAILVGEQIGERPNSYQEPDQFRLPNSHLIVRASTRYYTFRKHGPNAVNPDKKIVPSWDDVKQGRDPVLDWVLSQPVKAISR